MAELHKDGSIKPAATTTSDANPAATLPEKGIFIDGTLIGATARYYPPKRDKEGRNKEASVAVTYEVGFDPGVALVEKFINERDFQENGIVVKADAVTHFSRPGLYKPIKFRVAGHKIWNGVLTFTRAVQVI